MKRETKIIIQLISILLLVLVTLYLYLNKLYNYAIVITPIDIILLITLIIYTYTTRDEETLFKSNLNKILKTFDAVLVNSTNLIDLEGKNIIITNNIDDLIDAQLEIRKPIFYYKQTESCSFMLLDTDNALVYTLKKNDSVITPLEIALKELEIKKNNREKNLDQSILEQIEKTTIVKLEKGKSYKISPIRSKPKEEIEIL